MITVYSGHFHHKSDDGQIYYLGTPYEIIGQIGMTLKVFISLIQIHRELERIHNPYTIYEKIYYDDTQEDYTKHDITQV